jgi:hypothetical protein
MQILNERKRSEIILEIVSNDINIVQSESVVRSFSAERLNPSIVNNCPTFKSNILRRVITNISSSIKNRKREIRLSSDYSHTPRISKCLQAHAMNKNTQLLKSTGMIRSSTWKNSDSSKKILLEINEIDNKRLKKPYFRIYSKSKNLVKCRTHDPKYVLNNNSLNLPKAHSLSMKKYLDKFVFE